MQVIALPSLDINGPVANKERGQTVHKEVVCKQINWC